MIPFVKIYTRRLHVTSKIFLRKIAPKASNNDQNHEISENNTDSPSNFQTSCIDYLGIESEENVIAVIPQKHTFQQLQTNDTKEKFYRASFGIVRLDSDNKLRRHGQYERKVDFVFPHSSSKSAKVNDVSGTPNSIVQHLSWTDSQKETALDTSDTKASDSSSFEKKDVDKNYIDECYFDLYETNNFSQNRTQSPALEKLNFIEKDYFETLDQSRNNADSIKKIDSAFCSKNKVEEINYCKNDYFENNPEKLHVNQNSADYSNLGDQNQLEETNYSEKDNYLSSENLVEEKTSVSSNFINDVHSSWSTDDKSKNDYLGTLNSLESHPAKQNISQHYTDDYEIKMSSVYSKSNFDALNELSFLDKKLFENSSSPNSLNSLQYDELAKSSAYFVENNNINNKDIDNQLNQDDKTMIENEISNFESSDYSADELKKTSLEQAYKVNSEKLTFSKNPQNEIISRLNNEQSTKNFNLSKELLNETLKPYSMKNNLKFSKIASEEDIQENQEPTAHDFVEKLREEQRIPSQIILKGKSKSEEKFDSKGFRILKNQVPDLSYFTRDEILNILKQNVVYSDDDLLVLNKPYGLVIHDSQTTKEPCLSTFLDDLAKEIDKQSASPKLFTVHRLDKETTGCILLARNETKAMHLKALFAQRKIVKKYWVITSGVPDPPEGVIDIPISEGSINNKKRMVLHPKLPSDILYNSHSRNGKPAVTTYKVISESGNAALVEVFPKTGVKHQIRVHFGFGIGCPILGDHKYSHLDKLAPQKLPSDMLQKLHVRQSKVRHIPMHIHAKSVGIPEYFDKRDLFVNIPIPEHFKTNLKRLKFRKKDMIH